MLRRASVASHVAIRDALFARLLLLPRRCCLADRPALLATLDRST